MATFSASQVMEHQSTDSCWVIYKNKVYNVTDFVIDHPGGRDIILEYAGTDITDVLGDESVHTHSDAAYELLDEYYIGELGNECSSNTSTPALSVNGSSDLDDDLTASTSSSSTSSSSTLSSTINNSFNNQVFSLKDKQGMKKSIVEKPVAKDNGFLDLRQPLFPQLWNATWSKDFYLEQVHRPRFVPYYVPYFSQPWLDVLSHTPWYIVPIIWIPFVCYQLWCSVNSYNGSPMGALEGFAGGVFFWTLLEYGLHRFIFHFDDWLPDHPIALLLHFTLHGIHHHMPMDRLRLVMPPALAALIGFPIIRSMHILFNTPMAHAMVAGAYFGYICYDCIHYYLHHAHVIRIHFGEMKRYHLAHHYKDFEGGYGITSKLWDIVFGTTLKT
ncbi:hypothetical protein INT45_006745 [Circinella minor]|uniref:Ceramide very long chain fatty acid hydroxylase n=1 Tax=Circinella minor TaxID=1195481 RepID=A0A8H7VKW1_9FUNG|nr:hypothetical protein INT45_006745 [Circinella minor]